MKNRLIKFILFIVVMMFSVNVKANNINKINIDVYIDSNGNANIIEKWYANINTGTEGYRLFSKLDSMEITDLSVTDESGRIFDLLDTWNTNNSFSNKAYKSALINKGSESELYFGISSYGSKEYTIKYNVSNIVRNYSDVQALYYSFLQMDMDVSEAIITIHSDIPFSLDNSRIWGLGYEGEINFDNGNIVLTTKNGLNKSNRMVALVRFEEELFNVNLNIDKSFDDIYDEAFKEDTTVEDTPSTATIVIILIVVIIVVLFVPILIVVFIVRMVKRFKKKDYSKGNHGKYLDFGKDGKKLPKDIPYWREIPCYNNINYTYWLCDEFYILKEEEIIKGIIGAYLLKWFRDDQIKIIKEKNKDLIDLTSDIKSNDSVEKAIYYLMQKASGENKILESKEFEKWSKKNYQTIYNLGNEINSYVIRYLEDTGDLVRKSSKKAFDFEIKDSIKEEAIRVKGFIKYLNDFSKIEEKKHIEVKLWNEYLIFAELFGVADKVREEFKKLYPDMKDIKNAQLFEKFDLYGNIVSDISTACAGGAKKGYASVISSVINVAGTLVSSSGSHDYSGNSSSSGGGGSSSSSGGSSAGGSSGGGFR